MSVSYTHLDVYKRQQEDGPAQFNEQRADYDGGDEGDHGPQVPFVQQVRQKHAVCLLYTS